MNHKIMDQRICLALDLKEDLEAIKMYELYHRSVWPEVLDSIRSAGIEVMEIYRTGNRLFMIMEVTTEFNSEKKAQEDANNKKVQEWESLMDTFQQRLPWAKEGQKWVTMDKIFDLNEQL